MSSEGIFALATPLGRGAVAVIRVSGASLDGLIHDLFGRALSPRLASLRRIRDHDGQPLDEALALWFPGPRSFTGEDVLELHLHGGLAVIEAVSGRLMALGLRPAEPGEFTRRAFQNGRLDLSQAEAVADLVDAETADQRRQALANLGGRLSQTGARWRTVLVRILALLEVQVDFPDEEIPAEVIDDVRGQILALGSEFEAAIEDRSGEAVREGFRVAVIGPPNAGKSSLVNALSGRDVGLVSDIAGTTRDVLTAEVWLGGCRLTLCDTAGVRVTEDPLEVLGVARARTTAQTADLRVLVAPMAAAAAGPPAAMDVCRPGDFLVLSKSDEVDRGPGAPPGWSEAFASVFETSMADLDTLKGLRTALELACREGLRGGEASVVFRARHRQALQSALTHLYRALGVVGDRPELAAEDVRLATRQLERLSGRVGAEEVLDVVFGQFCIGK